MRDYWTPLATVPDHEMDAYIEALEEKARTRLEEAETAQFYAADEYSAVESMERNIYRGLLDGIDEIETKTDVFNYAREQIESESSLPAPFDFLMRPVDRLVEGQRELILQELFEEAKREVEA
ncbi:hypothetical protein ACK3SF_05085 [Candidatus Nanosalina sp. VS9-1]|uniref:hypothetical protein n=1 Tax=Candidatus Nanosalina sp. VS9-1 TaxID=3388566 RepID=UPI0039E01D98